MIRSDTSRMGFRGGCLQGGLKRMIFFRVSEYPPIQSYRRFFLANYALIFGQFTEKSLIKLYRRFFGQLRPYF